MLDDQEQSASESQGEETPEAKPEASKEAEAKPKRQPTEADIAALQSKYDRRIAALEKTAQEAERRATEREAEAERLRAEYELARQYGDDDDAKAAAKRLFDKEQALKAREREIRDIQRQLNEQAKGLKAAEFSREYGIPVDDLLDARSVEEMELRALRFRVAQQQGTPPRAPKPPTDEKPKPPRRPGYDTGEATRKPASFLTEPDPAKRQALWEQMKADAQRLRDR